MTCLTRGAMWMLGLLLGLHIAPPAVSLLLPSVVLTRASRSTNNYYAGARSSTTVVVSPKPIPLLAVRNNLTNSERRRRGLQTLHGSCRGDDESAPRVKRSESDRRVLTELRERKTDEAEDDSLQANFDRELEKDAELWVSGNPARQEFWDKAKARRRYSKMLRAREEALSELERDKLRYVLKDVETVTGLPLLKGKEITPLAWAITLSIQLLPFAAMYIIFTALYVDIPEPVMDVSKQLWT